MSAHLRGKACQHSRFLSPITSCTFFQGKERVFQGGVPRELMVLTSVPFSSCLVSLGNTRPGDATLSSAIWPPDVWGFLSQSQTQLGPRHFSVGFQQTPGVHSRVQAPHSAIQVPLQSGSKVPSPPHPFHGWHHPVVTQILPDGNSLVIKHSAASDSRRLGFDLGSVTEPQFASLKKGASDVFCLTDVL